jgi:hypothetical protein
MVYFLSVDGGPDHGLVSFAEYLSTVPKTAAASVIFTLSPAHIRESIDFRKFYYPHDEINRCTTNQYARLASQQDAEMLVVPILIPRACAKALQGRVM